MRKSTETVSVFCFLLVFILICGMTFTGCRRSEVLERKIYTEKQEIDWQNETKEKNNDEENQNEDQEITAREETEEAPTERNQTDTLSTTGSGDSGTAPHLEYGETAPANGETEASGEGTVTGNDTVDVGVTEMPEITPSSSGELQTVEEDGETITIPDSYSKVSAVGSAAVFVEIFGGQGKLKASSESFTGSTLSQNLFSDIGEVQTLWTGNGSTAISDDGLSQLVTLLTADQTGKGACLYDTGSLTSAQLKVLTDAGISAYPISLMQSSSQEYKDQVMAIGKVLGDDAENRAKDYCDWYDRIVDTAHSGAVETKYTLFVSGWDSTASWQVADRTGNGLAIAPSKSLVKLFNEFLAVAGVENRVKSVAGELGQPRNWYVNPLLGNGVYAVSLIGTLAEKLNEDEKNKLTSIYADGFYLGASSGEFASIIAADRKVAQSIQNDKVSGSGLWTNYGVQEVVGATGFGLTIGDSLVQSTIHGDYDIFALPQGIAGNWASGTPEGVLTSMWASSHFGGSVTENDVMTQLQYFYENFCGTSLSNEQITDLLAG